MAMNMLDQYHCPNMASGRDVTAIIFPVLKSQGFPVMLVVPRDATGARNHGFLRNL